MKFAYTFIIILLAIITITIQKKKKSHHKKQVVGGAVGSIQAGATMTTNPLKKDVKVNAGIYRARNYAYSPFNYATRGYYGTYNRGYYGYGYPYFGVGFGLHGGNPYYGWGSSYKLGRWLWARRFKKGGQCQEICSDIMENQGNCTNITAEHDKEGHLVCKCKDNNMEEVIRSFCFEGEGYCRKNYGSCVEMKRKRRK